MARDADECATFVTRQRPACGARSFAHIVFYAGPGKRVWKADSRMANLKPTVVRSETLSARIEEASLRAWPAFHEEKIGAWLVRIGNGYTKRANSATLTAAATTSDPLRRISTCEERYRAAGLPPCFRLPSFCVTSGVDAFLHEKGYHVRDSTVVSYLPLTEAEIPDGAPITPTEMEPWIATFAGLSDSSSSQVARHAQLLSAIRLPHVFARLEHEGDVVACGLGVLDAELFGLFDLITSEEHRNRGHGRRLVYGMLQWARERGARLAYLQVVEDNLAARRLYGRLGFREVYTYWYRVLPAGQAETS